MKLPVIIKKANGADDYTSDLNHFVTSPIHERD